MNVHEMSPTEMSEVAFAAAFGVGVIVDQVAIHIAAGKRQDLAEAPRLAFNTASEERSRFERMRDLFMSPLALAFAGAIALEAYALSPGPIIEQTKPDLQVVVDHSAATAQKLGGRPATEQINLIAKSLDNSRVNSTALVGSNGDVKSMPIADVIKQEPFGKSNLSQATTSALGNAERAVQAGSGSAKKRSSGVLVITNGNSIGTPKDVINTAALQNTPVYVVNVASPQYSDRAVTTGLQDIATQSDGKYWNAHDSNLDEVVHEVQQSLVPQEIKRGHTPDRWPHALLGGLLLLGAARLFVDRVSYPLNKGTTGVK